MATTTLHNTLAADPPQPSLNRSTRADGLATVLGRFAPITLGEMAQVALMDRSEQKYVVPQAALPELLGELSVAYRVLVVAGQRMSRYRTLYFDTENLTLYRRHHAGAPDRYKVRAREYVDSHAAFFEVKHRTPNQRTLKSRIATPALVTTLTHQTADFLTEATPYTADELHACLWNHYTRITLVSKTRPERVTLDLDLAFSWEAADVTLPGVVVAEVKYNGDAWGSAFVQAMRQRHLRATSFSKYCIGVSLLYPDAKQNRFKAKHRLIEALMRGENDGLH